jgi:hypothetical protein
MGLRITIARFLGTPKAFQDLRDTHEHMALKSLEPEQGVARTVRMQGHAIVVDDLPHQAGEPSALRAREPGVGPNSL